MGAPPPPYLRRMIRRRSGALLLLVLGGCAKYTAPTPVAYVSHGPAFGQPLNPIAALPVTCGSATLGCHQGYLVAVASATRMALELGGGSLVDSEMINAELRRRTTKTREVTISAQPGGEGWRDQQVQVEVSGLTWLDLPAEERRALLEQLGVTSLLTATISMSIPRGMAGQRTVSVQVVLRRLDDDTVAWQSECGVETGDYRSEPQALELAARCALESASLW